MLQDTLKNSQVTNQFRTTGRQTVIAALRDVEKAISDIGNILRDMLVEFTEALQRMSATLTRLLTASTWYLVNMDRRLMGLPVASQATASMRRTGNISACFKRVNLHVVSTDLRITPTCNPVQLIGTSWRLDVTGARGHVDLERMVVAQYNVRNLKEWVRLG
jgi:hypothetical protein